MHRAGAAEAGTQVVHANHKKTVGIDRLARADHGVPPALAPVLPGVHPRHMVRGIERMAHQHRIRARGIELAIGFKAQVVATDAGTALQGQRGFKMHGLWCG